VLLGDAQRLDRAVGSRKALATLDDEDQRLALQGERAEHVGGEARAVGGVAADQARAERRRQVDGLGQR
jgi:hypothetical protein